MRNTALQWKQKIVNLTTLSSLVAPWVVITTTYDATSDDKGVKLTTFCFQCGNDRLISTMGFLSTDKTASLYWEGVPVYQTM